MDICIETRLRGVLQELIKSPLHLKYILILVRKIEKTIGAPLLLEVDENLANLSNTPFLLKEAIDVAHELKAEDIVSQIYRPPRTYHDEPALIQYSVRSSKEYPNRGYGVDFFSEKRALWRALGECVERYLWRYRDFYSAKNIDAPYTQIKNSAIDPFSLAGFTDEQKNRWGDLQFTRETLFNWTQAYSLVHKKKIWCPTQLVSRLYTGQRVNAPHIERSEEVGTDLEPMLRWCVTTGLATGRTKEEALVAGILEIIERDAFMITHLNKLSPPRVDLEDYARHNREIETVLDTFKWYHLDVHALLLPTDLPVNVCCAVITDRTQKGPAVAVGASADFDLNTAVMDALSEALSVRLLIKNKGTTNLKKEALNQEGRLLHWAQNEHKHRLDFLFKGKTYIVSEKERAIPDNHNQALRHNKQQLKTLVNAFKEQNQELCFVDLSSPQTKKLGLWTIKAIAPKMQPLHLHEMRPYFGGCRLTEVPKKLGYHALEQINTDPHPFP